LLVNVFRSHSTSIAIDFTADVAPHKEMSRLILCQCFRRKNGLCLFNQCTWRNG